MHDPENPISNPDLFTNTSNLAIAPKIIAGELQNAVVQESAKLRNVARERGLTHEIGFLDGFNSVLARATNADRKQTPIGMNKDVLAFVQKYSDALGDLSDEIAVGSSEKTEGKLDIEARVDHAQINQRFSQALYSAARAPKGDPQRKNAEIFYSTMSHLRKEGTALGNAAVKELDAARAQSAAMLVFENAGFQVLVPDHEDRDEIRDMDVLAMADLVVVAEGEVFFIDVKGRHFDDRGRTQEVVESRGKIIDRRDPNADLRINASKALMNQVKNEHYSNTAQMEPNRVELTIPTDDSCLSPLGEVLNESLVIDILRSVRR